MVLPPPPPLPLSELLLSSPPQAVTPRASAPMRQPVAANQRKFKEPLLIKGLIWAAILRTARSGRATECHEERQIACSRRTGGCAAGVRIPGGYPGDTEPRDAPRRR